MASAIDETSVEKLANSIRDIITGAGLGILGEPKRFYAMLADYYGDVAGPEMTIFSQALVKGGDDMLLPEFAVLSGNVKKEELLALADRGAQRLVNKKLASKEDARACMIAIALGVGRALGVGMGTAKKLLNPEPKEKQPTKPQTTQSTKPPVATTISGKQPTKPASTTTTRTTTVPGGSSQPPTQTKSSSGSHLLVMGAIVFVLLIIIGSLFASESDDPSGSSDKSSSGYSYHSSASSTLSRSTSSSVVQPRSSSTSTSAPSSSTQSRPASSTPRGVHEMLPRSDVDHYVYSDIHCFSDFELFVARNEMYARKGYAFETPFTRDYFAWTNMYTVTTSDYDAVDASMNDAERSNINLILELERQRQSPFIDDAYVKKLDFYNFDTEHILPSASSISYTSETLSRYSSFELFIARNEFYAKRGYRFETDYLAKYFDRRSWYAPTTSDYDAVDAAIKGVERSNIEKIIDIEKSRNSPYLDNNYIAKL